MLTPACAACLSVVLSDTTVPASVSLTIGTDCVGAFDAEFGACTNVCGDGEMYKFYTIVSDSTSATDSTLPASASD